MATKTTAKRQTKPRKAKVKGLANGVAVWVCPSCDRGNAIDEEKCLNCGTPKSEVEFFKGMTPPDRTSGKLTVERNGHTPDAAAAGDERDVPISKIHPSPDNPRKHFDEDKLKELADSIKKHGLLQYPLVYQPADKLGFELIAGERRWRAAKLAKLETIRVRVLDVTDDEAVELRGIENLKRDDMNPLEEAGWYRQMLDRCGYTQQSLAKRLGCSQGKIGNALLLLDLPDDWQDKLISRVITPTHARALMAWRDRPGVLDHLAKRLGQAEEPPSVRDFADLVHGAVRDCTKPLAQWQISFKLTKARRAELDVVEVPTPYGHTEERAFNVALWNKLEREAKKKQREKAKQESKPSAKPADKGEASGNWPMEGRARDRWEQWYRHTIAERLTRKHKSLVLRLTLWFDLALGECQEEFALAAGRELPSQWGGDWHADMWHLIASIDDKRLPAVLLDYVRRVLIEDSPWQWNRPAPALWQPIAAELGIDPQKDWTPDFEWLDLFETDELQRMPCKEMVAPDVLEDLGKTGLIERLLEHWQPGYVPPALLEVLESSGAESDG